MAGKKFVAIDNFCLNLDNGKSTVNVKKGDPLTFDGLNVEIDGITGQNRSLVKVIGEWIQPVAGALPKRASVIGASQIRNATGGRILESSSAEDELRRRASVRKSESFDEIQRIIEANESHREETKITSDMGDIKDEIRRKIIDEDQIIVAQVSDSAKTDVPSNPSGIIIEEQKNERRLVISNEEQVVKETDYSGTKKEAQQKKPLTIDYESDGVVVKKVATPAINTTQERATEKSAPRTVTADEVVVKETSYENPGSTDISSSTQVSAEQTGESIKKAAARKSVDRKEAARKAAATRKANTAKKAAARKAEAMKAEAASTEESNTPAPAQATAEERRRPVVVSDDQEAVVVARVRKIDMPVSSEGIESTVTVGSSGEFDEGKAVFGSNTDMTITTEITGPGSTRADNVISDDIDVSDILTDL